MSDPNNRETSSETKHAMQNGHSWSTADESKYWQALDVIIKRAAKDKAFERHFISEQGNALAEAGVELPSDVAVEVVKYREHTRYIFLPPDDPTTDFQGEHNRWAGVVVSLEKAEGKTVIGVIEATGNGQWWMIIPDPRN